MAKLAENIQQLDRRIEERSAALAASNRELLQQGEKLRQSEQAARHERDVAFAALAEQQMAETRLTGSEKRFRSLFEGSSDAILLFNTTGFTDCNQAALELFGCTDVASFTRLKPADLSPPRQPDGRDSATAVQSHVTRALQQGSVLFEWRYWRMDDHREFVAEVLVNRINPAGTVLQAVVRDISKRKQAEAALLSANAELRMLDAAKTDFLLLVSHQLRTPLTRFIDCAYAVRQRLADIDQAFAADVGKGQRQFARLEKDLTIIVFESERLRKLVSDVQDSARLEAGSYPFQFAAHAPADLIAAALAAMQSQAQQRGMKLIEQVADRLPPVRADAQRIEQAADQCPPVCHDRRHHLGCAKGRQRGTFPGAFLRREYLRRA